MIGDLSLVPNVPLSGHMSERRGRKLSILRFFSDHVTARNGSRPLRRAHARWRAGRSRCEIGDGISHYDGLIMVFGFWIML